MMKSKRPIENWRASFIPTSIPATSLLKSNSKYCKKRTTYFQIKRIVNSMTSTVRTGVPLKLEQVRRHHRDGKELGLQRVEVDQAQADSTMVILTSINFVQKAAHPAVEALISSKNCLVAQDEESDEQVVAEMLKLNSSYRWKKPIEVDGERYRCKWSRRVRRAAARE